MDWTRPAGATRLVLVRHGETEEAARGRCVGRLEVGLSARGAEQARRCAEWVRPAGISALYASPSRRALDSARPIAAACGVGVEEVEALREIDFGALEGLTLDEASSRHPAVFRAWMTSPASVTFPCGESYRQLRDRAHTALSSMLSRHRDETIAIVSHGGTLRALLAHALGLPDEHAFRLDLSCCGVTVVDWFADTRVVRLVNHVP